MRRIIARFIIAVLFLVILISALNLEVGTRQGINYQWHTLRIPLYVKLLNFFDRHYNYAQLSKRIIAKATNDEERLMRLFVWTQQNIRPVPEGFPVVDDHTWNIIVRGYGTDDQAQDVFATLCNYARLKALFYKMHNPITQESKYIAFVKLGNKWRAFDAYYGVYFLDTQGRFASGEDLSAGQWQLAALPGAESKVNYQSFFSHLEGENFDNWFYSKAALQSPFNRIFFGTRKK